jgi:hypothetical protein
VCSSDLSQIPLCLARQPTGKFDQLQWTTNGHPSLESALSGAAGFCQNDNATSTPLIALQLCFRPPPLSNGDEFFGRRPTFVARWIRPRRRSPRRQIGCAKVT